MVFVDLLVACFLLCHADFAAFVSLDLPRFQNCLACERSKNPRKVAFSEKESNILRSSHLIGGFLAVLRNRGDLATCSCNPFRPHEGSLGTRPSRKWLRRSV